MKQSKFILLLLATLATTAGRAAAQAETPTLFPEAVETHGNPKQHLDLMEQVKKMKSCFAAKVCEREVLRCLREEKPLPQENLLVCDESSSPGPSVVSHVVPDDDGGRSTCIVYTDCDSRNVLCWGLGCDTFKFKEENGNEDGWIQILGPDVISEICGASNYVVRLFSDDAFRFNSYHYWRIDHEDADEEIADMMYSIVHELTDEDIRSVLQPLGLLNYSVNDCLDLALGLALYFGIGCETNTAAARVLLGELFVWKLDRYWNGGDAFDPEHCDDVTILDTGRGLCDRFTLEEAERRLTPWQFGIYIQDELQNENDCVIVSAEVAKWFRKGAECETWNGKKNHDRARAAFWLGMCHARGYGVEKNMEEAAMWFRKSCDYGGVGFRRGSGTNYPQICLAICNLLGLGTKRDFATAVDNLYPRFWADKNDDQFGPFWEKYEWYWNERHREDHE